MKRSIFSVVWILLAVMCILWPVTAFCNFKDAFTIDAYVGYFPPKMSVVLSQTILEDKTSQPIPLTLTDPYSNENKIDLFFESNNQTIIPNENILIEGTGKNRTIKITPTANEFGALSITIMATNDGGSATQKFSVHVLPVDDKPVISTITDQNTIQDTATRPPIPFTISDVDSQSLTIWCQSSDAAFVESFFIQDINPNGQIQISPGTIYDVSLTVTPAEAVHGAVSITVFVEDDTQRISESVFSLFIDEAMYQIITAASGQGKITPTNPILKKYDQVVIRMTPDAGFMIKDVIVDGISKGPMPRYIAYGTDPPSQLTAVFGPPEEYTITTIVSTDGIISPVGGAISPVGPVKITQNMDQLFHINTQFGYVLTDVLVDGQSINPVILYEFQNVVKNHSIEAIFRQASPPTADFTSNVAEGFLPLKVQFADKSFIENDDGGDEITDWLWDFGDGAAKSTNQNPIHYYTNEGQYTVTLTTTGTGGLTDTMTKTGMIVVQPSDVYHNFSVDKTDISKGDTVQFTAQSNITTGASWLWNFGDDASSTLQNPSHLYEKAGKYTVSLTISVAGNDYVKTKTKYIKVGGRTISGQIRAGDKNGIDTGMPLASYWIEVWHTGSSPIAYTHTDANGCYTITGLPPDTGFVVAAFPPAGTNAYFEDFYRNQSSFATAHTINLIDNDHNDVDFVLKQVPQYGISGKIHTGANALSNVEVTVFSEDANFSARTTSNAQGNYTLTGLKLASDYKVFAFYDNAEYFYNIPDDQTVGVHIPTCEDTVSRWSMAKDVTPTDPITNHIDLVLCHSGTINGHVYDSNTQPLQNIWVNASSDLLMLENGVLTDQNGEYTITGLTIVSNAEVLTKGYRVEIFDDNYPYQAYPQKSNMDDATRISANKNLEIVFILKKSANISGRVFDKYNNPVPNVQLTAYSKAYPASKQGMTTTNANGLYTLTNLPFATDYIVAAFSDYFPAQYYNLKPEDEMDQAEAVSLAYGDVSDIDFVLDEGAIIKGFVKISDAGETRDAQNIWVDIHSQSQPDSGGQVKTNSVGYYEMTGLDDTITDYVIQVKLSGYQPAYYHPTEPDTTVYLWNDAEGVAPSTDTDRNLLIVKGFSIKGLVTFQGEPIKGLQVIAYSDSGGNGSAISTQNDTENYAINGLSNGTYTVFIVSDQYADATLENVLINGANIDHIDISLALPERKIQGTVYQLGDTKSLKLLVFSIDGDDSKIIELVGDGSPMPYTINALKPYSDYKMQLYSNDYPDQIYNNQTSINDADMIDLATTNATGIDITLNADVSIITGAVEFPGTASLGDTAWVDVQSESTGSQGAAEVKKLIHTNDPVSDAYTITGLPKADDFLVHVWSDKYLTQYYENADNENEATPIDTTGTYETGGINFTLDPGATIFGKIVDEYKDGLNNIYVEASSDSTSSIRGTMSTFDGNFSVKGLKTAGDYKLKAVKQGVDLPFFYNQDQTVRDRSLATSISTLGGNPPSIEMILSEGLSIAGTIRDALRNPILNEKIWINISSDSRQIDVGDYINKDGTYQISGLPSGQDYQVDAQPPSSSSYLPATKSNIESGQSNVDLYLSTGSKISGYVRTNTDEALRNVRVNISSVSQALGKWVKTKADGYYEIKGLPNASDYAIIATPPENSSYVEFSEFGLVIASSLSKNIVLMPAMTFTGYVYKADNVTPIKNAWVSAFSQSSDNFMKGQRTDKNGKFEINNVPDASDFVIRVQADGYLAQKLENQSPGGADIQFQLVESGSISGSVKNTSGQAISEARVKATSSKVNDIVVVVTGSNGKYELSGLKKTDSFGTPISYQITVEIKGYQSQTKVEKQVGDVVDFQMSTGGTISGTIRDANGNTPPQQYKIAVSVFEKLANGRLKIPPVKTSTDSNGQFIVKGLTDGVPYVIQVRSNIVGNLENKLQWVGTSQEGVFQYTNAIEVSPGEVIDFNFKGTF
jgi:PKD repeat protein